MTATMVLRQRESFLAMLFARLRCCCGHFTFSLILHVRSILYFDKLSWLIDWFEVFCVCLICDINCWFLDLIFLPVAWSFCAIVGLIDWLWDVKFHKLILSPWLSSHFYLRLISAPSALTYEQLAKENSDLRDYFSCKICMSADAIVAFSPCGHICCCIGCGSNQRFCPYCRRELTDRLTRVAAIIDQYGFCDTVPNSPICAYM